MNKIFTFLLVACFSVAMTAQVQPEAVGAEKELKEAVEQMDSQDQSGPFMEFDAMSVDYGEIDQHSEPLRVLKFRNTGDEPLVIKNARGSCGCTVPIWPKEPILPGEESVIEIRYDTKRLGKINKRVTITTNEVGTEPHVIQVIGKISKVQDEENVPASAPSMLKSNG